jgi:hypothetical protein
MTSNRQINTGFDAKAQMITLEATKIVSYDGKQIDAGQSVTVSKSEAKRLLSLSKGVFRIKMD